MREIRTRKEWICDGCFIDYPAGFPCWIYPPDKPITATTVRYCRTCKGRIDRGEKQPFQAPTD